MRILVRLGVAFLLAVCAPFHDRAAAQPYPPICNVTDYQNRTGPQLPSLPSQFSTTIQAYIFSLSKEIVVREYFDEINNRGRLEFSSAGWTGYGIFDYGQQEIFLFKSNEDCVVRKINVNNRFLRDTFGFTVVNGSVHIGTVSDFFRLAKNDTRYIRYEGPDEIRGVECDHWQTCHVSENRSYILDYYFTRKNSVFNWTSAFDNDPIPVQISLNGTHNNGTPVQNVYSFVGFNSGQDSVPDEVFRLPTGTVCRGRIPGQDVPRLPNFFSTHIESVNEDRQTSRIFTEFYDFEQQLFRFDFYYSGHHGGSAAPLSIIHNFNLETQYVINKQFRNCSVEAITVGKQLFDAKVTDGRPQLSSPADLFLVSNEFNYSYEGVSTIRGVDVDSWISYRSFESLSRSNLSNATYEIFFTRPEWSLQTASSAPSSSPVPFRVRLTGIISFINSSTNLTETRNISTTYDLFSFSAEEPDLDVFDISLCIPATEYYVLTMKIDIGENLRFSTLQRNIRKAFAKYTGMELLQIGNIEVIADSNNSLLITLHLSNLSLPARNQVKNMVTAQQAVDNIIKDISSSEFSLKIELAPNIYATPTQIKIRTINSTIYPNSNSDGDDADLSERQVAAIAVVLLVVGMLIGALVTLAIALCVVYLRSRSSRVSVTTGGMAYKRHEDEVTADPPVARSKDAEPELENQDVKLN